MGKDKGAKKEVKKPKQNKKQKGLGPLTGNR
jgi:hypothetical protein